MSVNDGAHTECNIGIYFILGLVEYLNIAILLPIGFYNLLLVLEFLPHLLEHEFFIIHNLLTIGNLFFKLIHFRVIFLHFLPQSMQALIFLADDAFHLGIFLLEVGVDIGQGVDLGLEVQVLLLLL